MSNSEPNPLSADPSERYDEAFIQRPRGIFSPADRKLLAGRTEYKQRQTKYDRLLDCRERVKNAILDLPLALDAHEQYGAELVYEDTTGNEVKELDAARQSGFGLLYGLGRGAYIGLNRESPTELAENGIERGEQLMHNRTVDAQLKVSETTVDVERVAKLLDTGRTEQLESHEKAWLLAVLDSSDFSGDELRKTVETLPEDAAAKRAIGDK